MSALAVKPLSPGTTVGFWAARGSQLTDAVARWLNDPTGRHELMVANPVRVGVYTEHDMSWVDAEIRTTCLRRQKVEAPAPYVGKPYRYGWWVAVDDRTGIQVQAGEAERWYEP